MVSIVMPTFNRSREISRAIQSVLDQSFKEWELIIIDDGSKDDTFKVVEKFRKKNYNIHYHYFFNMGAGAARNIGVCLSKGELIAFLDSDDIWTKNRLQKVYEAFVKSVNENRFFFTDFRSNLKDKTQFMPSLINHSNFRQSLYAINPLGGASNLVIPRKMLYEVGGFDAALTSTEDHELYVRLYRDFNLAYVPGEDAVNYVEATNRLSGKNKRRLKGQLMYYNKHKKDMSYLSRLLVMKKNALLAYYVNSPMVIRYLPGWITVNLLKKIYRVEDETQLFLKKSSVLNYLIKN